MDCQLSSGAIKRAMAGETAEKPTVQVIDVKKLPGKEGPHQDRYRLVMSDGDFFTQGMLATQHNVEVINGNLLQWDIIRIDEHIANFIQNRRVLIVLKFSVLSRCDYKIGNPQNVESNGAPQDGYGAGDTTQQAPPPQRQAPPQQQRPPQQQYQQQPQQQSWGQGAPQQQARPQPPSMQPQRSAPQNSGNPSRPIAQSSAMPSGQYTPLDVLTPYNQRWNIRVRITNKSTTRQWSNQRGQGQMFNIEMVDDRGGEMRATFFTEGVKKWYDYIEQGKVYSIQKGTIKTADKRFNRTNSQYEMTLDQNSIIELVSDGSTDAIPRVNYKFVQIASIQDRAANTIIDVLGVVREVRPLAELKSRNTGKDLIKRDIELVDGSSPDGTGRSIILTLWGDKAQMPVWDELNGRQPVVAVKNCKISDYNGKSLSTLNDSAVELDPDLNEGHALRGWWDAGGCAAGVSSLSTAAAGGGSGIRPTDPRKTLSAVSEEGLGTKEKPDIFVTRAYVAHIRTDGTHFYPSCPGNNGDCKKKLIFDQSQGKWRCEKCNGYYDAPIYRYILNFNAADHTSTQYLSAYDNEGQLILGMSAQELNEIKEQNPVQYEGVLVDAQLKRYILKVRVKSEMWNDESRVKCGVLHAQLIDYPADMEELVRSISQF